MIDGWETVSSWLFKGWESIGRVGVVGVLALVPADIKK